MIAATTPMGMKRTGPPPRYYLRRQEDMLVRMLAPFVVLLTLAFSSGATVAAQQGETVTVTFELTIKGEPPKGVPVPDTFQMTLFEGHSDDGLGHVFCGPGPKGSGEIECEGGETFRTGQMRFEKGSEVRYSIWKQSQSGSGGTFIGEQGGVRTLAEDTVIRVVFDYNKPGEEEQEADRGESTQVTPTFELTVEGTVPQGEGFYVQYETQDSRNTVASLWLCKPAEGCTGEGRKYSVEGHPLPSGTPIEYRFWRGEREELIRASDIYLTRDTTLAAHYAYTDGNGQEAKFAPSLRLVLNGAVPRGESFRVVWRVPTPKQEEDYNPEHEKLAKRPVLCEGAHAPVCEGGGKAYTTETVSSPRGRKVHYRVERTTGGFEETVVEGLATITGNHTITDYYDFPEAGNGWPHTNPATITYRLTISGTPPPGEVMRVHHGAVGLRNPRLPLCGEEGVPKCEGGGTVYSRSVTVTALPQHVYYDFVRNPDDEGIGIGSEYFQTGGDRVTRDVTYTATYTYGVGTQDEEPTTPGAMPSTGGGGMAKQESPRASCVPILVHGRILC